VETPLRITFREMPPSAAVERRVRDRASALERLHPKITGCHVVVEAQHRHHRQGHIYHVTVHLVVPEGEIVVTRDPAQHHAHEDVYVAVRDAFDAAARRLQDQLHRLRGAVKQHELPVFGSVERIFPERDYGVIRSAIDGQEIYFHRNSVLDGNFDSLRVGTEVRYALHEGEGEQGAQASTVRLIGKHHAAPPPP
jgi:ribosome-associated translation inhibitor RaiA/cold shock CspA family protein